MVIEQDIGRLFGPISQLFFAMNQIELFISIKSLRLAFEARVISFAY